MDSSFARFPATRPSLLAALRGTEAPARRVAWEALVRAYWKPAYKHLRLQWHADVELASDWTQEFFARALEKGFFDRFDPAQARFRTFLRVCLDGFAAKERQAAQRLKRGGGVATLPLDFTAAEGELAGREPVAPDEVDAAFQREWMRSLFQLALADLQEKCAEQGKERQLELLRRYDLEPADLPEGAPRPSYADLAQELGVPATTVTNWLHWARRELRECVLSRLRELCHDDDEFRAEARALLGVDPR